MIMSQRVLLPHTHIPKQWLKGMYQANALDCCWRVVWKNPPFPTTPTPAVRIPTWNPWVLEMIWVCAGQVTGLHEAQGQLRPLGMSLISCHRWFDLSFNPNLTANINGISSPSHSHSQQPQRCPRGSLHQQYNPSKDTAFTAKLKSLLHCSKMHLTKCRVFIT